MNWSAYIVLAEELAKFGIEPMDRSAVSRAYYGAFNVSRRWLEAHGTSIDDRGAHRQVWQAFRAAEGASDGTRQSWKVVGNLGASLRGLRNQADYADFVPGLGGGVTSAVGDAKRILTLLPGLELAD